MGTCDNIVLHRCVEFPFGGHGDVELSWCFDGQTRLQGLELATWEDGGGGAAARGQQRT